MCLIGKDLWGIVTGPEIMDNDLSDAKKRKFKKRVNKHLLLFVWVYRHNYRFKLVQLKPLKTHGKILRNTFN